MRGTEVLDCGPKQSTTSFTSEQWIHLDCCTLLCVPLQFPQNSAVFRVCNAWKDAIKMDLGEVCYGNVKLIVIAEGSVRQEAVVNTVMNFSCSVRDYQCQLLKDFTPWNQFVSGQRKAGHPCVKTLMYDVLTWPFVQLPSR
jgi:hypothetical protein